MEGDNQQAKESRTTELSAFFFKYRLPSRLPFGGRYASHHPHPHLNNNKFCNSQLFSKFSRLCVWDDDFDRGELSKS